jgi:epoxyqueuosine reductase
MTATAELKRRALQLGFAAAGIAPLEPNAHANEFDQWLGAGYAGTMTYLHRQAEKRRDPRLIMPGARSAVVTLTNYFHEAHSTNTPDDVRSTRVAQYAWSADYHTVLAPRLEQLAGILRDLVPGAQTRCYVDAGPLPERELAQLAGLGWIGKNMMLIHPRIGSFTFIGVVLTDVQLEADVPFAGEHCGTCRRCLDACPTNAFVAPGVLDARRCISYVTIEHRGAFDAGQETMLGEWLFGCDVCQDVCPWNVKFAVPTGDPELAPRAALRQPDTVLLRDIDDAAFDREFGDTPLSRPGARGMRRNAAAIRERT